MNDTTKNQNCQESYRQTFKKMMKRDKITLKKGPTVAQFKDKWGLTLEQLAYTLSMVMDGELKVYSTPTVADWVKNKTQPKPAIPSLLQDIDREWSIYLKRYKRDGDSEIKRLYKVDEYGERYYLRPRDIIFVEVVFPNYKTGSMNDRLIRVDQQMHAIIYD